MTTSWPLAARWLASCTTTLVPPCQSTLIIAMLTRTWPPLPISRPAGYRLAPAADAVNCAF